MSGFGKSDRGGTYRLLWEQQVRVVDGASCGFAAPTRLYGESANG